MVKERKDVSNPLSYLFVITIFEIGENPLKVRFLLQRQDIYDGSDYDWDGFPVEDTPTWPPDYNAWPQAATQAPSQVVIPQLPQQVPTQPPFQAQQLGPYRVPPAVTNQIGTPVESKVEAPSRISISTTQTQPLTPRLNPYKDLK